MTLQPVWSEKESFKGRWFHISGVWTLSCGCQFWLYTNGQKLVLRPNVTNCKTAWETYSLAGWPILAETWGWAVPCLITQSCPTVCDPLDCSPQGSSVHGILQARILEWVAIFLLQGIFLTQGWSLHLLHCRWTPFYTLWKWIWSVLLRFFPSLLPMEIGNIFVWLWYQGETGLTEWVGEILPNI